jgi:ribosomal protein S18 acetylase RimI-like enzyme
VAGRGLGRRLVEGALAATRDHGLARCVLEVADTNERAIALYRAFGFTTIGAGATTDPATGARLGSLHMARDV